MYHLPVLMWKKNLPNLCDKYVGDLKVDRSVWSYWKLEGGVALKEDLDRFVLKSYSCSGVLMLGW